MGCCSESFGLREFTITWDTTPPIGDQIKAAENILESLKEKKAKQDREAAESSKPTAGQILAAKYIFQSSADPSEWGPSGLHDNWFTLCESDDDYGNKHATEARAALAEMVDTAMSDARAEQREADAKIAEGRTSLLGIGNRGHLWVNVGVESSEVARLIRIQK